ncbi:unnamed protein product, partial [marine sediment metagenome]
KELKSTGRGKVYITLQERNTNPCKLSDLIVIRENFPIDNLKHFLMTDYGIRVEVFDDLDKNKTTEGLAILNAKDATDDLAKKYLKYKNAFESTQKIKP